MSGAIKTGTICLALLAIPSAAEASPQSRAEAIVAASKRASGGTAWDRPQGCYEEGTRGNGTMTYRTWFDLRKYGLRVESRKGGSTQTIGFNGKASWRTNAAGTTDIRESGDALREAFLTTYLSSNGFFFPKRFPASFRYLREITEGGRRFDVIEIAPRDGRPIDVWFDRTTHLIERIVDSHGNPPVKVEADDYRRIGKLMVAFGLTVVAPDGTILERGKLTSIACGGANRRVFDPPESARR